MRTIFRNNGIGTPFLNAMLHPSCGYVKWSADWMVVDTLEFLVNPNKHVFHL
jgi:hypothetical protein